MESTIISFSSKFDLCILVNIGDREKLTSILDDNSIVYSSIQMVSNKKLAQFTLYKVNIKRACVIRKLIDDSKILHY